jgi:hypothetical protein
MRVAGSLSHHNTASIRQEKLARFLDFCLADRPIPVGADPATCPVVALQLM